MRTLTGDHNDRVTDMTALILEPIVLESNQKDPQIICYGISAYDSNSMKSSNPHSGIYKADTSRTLDLNGGNPACNQGGVIILEATREPQAVAYTVDMGGGKSSVCTYEDQAPTLACTHYGEPVVAYGVTTKGNGDAFIARERHTSLAIGGGQAGQGYPCVLYPQN